MNGGMHSPGSPGVEWWREMCNVMGNVLLKLRSNRRHGFSVPV